VVTGRTTTTGSTARNGEDGLFYLGGDAKGNADIIPLSKILGDNFEEIPVRVFPIHSFSLPLDLIFSMGQRLSDKDGQKGTKRAAAIRKERRLARSSTWWTCSPRVRQTWKKKKTKVFNSGKETR
jgi:hypothetical protein